jgi:multiple sugar transport system ATP-binding protein
MAELLLDNLSKRFADGTLAVDDLSLTVADGELLVLLGPSGCGKSTLLKMIVGLEEITCGTISLGGRIINDLPVKDRNMAMVFQSYALYPHLTVRENIAFPLKMAKIPRRELDERVERTADMMELGALLDRKPRSLSGGQRQRVAIGRAIVREPAAFLLDEPLSNLDARLRTQMRAELARLQRRLGTTTIYVTHDQTEAMTLGDRVAVLDAGALQQVGAPRALYEQPRNLFVASFLGSPPINLLPANIEGETMRLPTLGFDLPVPAALKGRASGVVIAGIRPEHLYALSAPRPDVPLSAAFAVETEVAEWLGAELIVRCTTPGQAALPGLAAKAARVESPYLVARLDAAAPAEARTLELMLDTSKLHYFDADSGERLL